MLEIFVIRFSIELISMTMKVPGRISIFSRIAEYYRDERFYNIRMTATKNNHGNGNVGCHGNK